MFTHVVIDVVIGIFMVMSCFSVTNCNYHDVGHCLDVPKVEIMFDVNLMLRQFILLVKIISLQTAKLI